MFIPLPPWGTGRRGRRIPPLVLIKKGLVQVALLQIRGGDGAYLWLLLGSMIGVSTGSSARFVQWDKTSLSYVSRTLPRMGNRSGFFLCKFVHLDALLLGPANLDSRWKRSWIPSNFFLRHLLRALWGHEMFFLCLRFAVPSTTKSLLLDDVVLDWQSIQLLKIWDGFTFFQEMSTSVIAYSLIPIKKAFWALHFWNCFA